jgi:hypothetical protein
LRLAAFMNIFWARYLLRIKVDRPKKEKGIPGAYHGKCFLKAM